MLSNEDFFYESVNNHSYFLRSIRFFCLAIELAFFENNIDYINLFDSFGKKAEELGKRALNDVKGKYNEEFIGKEILITPYSLESEQLTKKLFDIDVNTNADIINALNNLKSVNGKINDNDIKVMEKLNQDILSFATNFQELCLEVKTKLDNDELFSYLYPEFFNYIYDLTSFYIRELNRLINRESNSIVYDNDSEYYFNNLLKKTSEFIRIWTDPNYQDVYDMASFFVNAFENLINEYLLAYNSSINRDLKNKTKNLLENYQGFISNILKKIFTGEVYLITPPIIIDNLLTSINYYLYIINKK